MKKFYDSQFVRKKIVKEGEKSSKNIFDQQNCRFNFHRIMKKKENKNLR